MRWLSRQPWGKWALFGTAASVAVMAMGSGEDEMPAKGGRGKMQQVAMAASLSRETQKPLAAEERVELERMLRQQRPPEGERQVGNVFNATSWYVPPPPQPVPPQNLPPPRPTAPPLPFTYIGEYKDAESAAKIIFLSSADRVYAVSEGDVIDGTYGVGPITSGQIEITYLPLNIKQSLNTGGVL